MPFFMRTSSGAYLLLQVVHAPKTGIQPQPQNPLAHTAMEHMAQFYCEGWVYSAHTPLP
jgi:hypothetical protein